MKRSIHIKYFILLILLTVFKLSVYCQQMVVPQIKQVLDITMDNLGNAMIEVSSTLNAAQWDMFKKNIGNNTSILKREMEKALPKYYLSDFSYSEDPMERSYKLKFKALGLCTLDNNGRWVSNLETKNPDITKLSEREFLMTADISANGMLVQQTQKLHLPMGTKNAKIEKDSFGKALMTYSTPNGILPGFETIGGIILLLAGIVLFITSNNSVSKNKLRVAKPSVAA